VSLFKGPFINSKGKHGKNLVVSVGQAKMIDLQQHAPKLVLRYFNYMYKKQLILMF
jgi:hypothetical protein